MAIQKNKIFITADHFKVFREASYDCNPLHTDNSYARRTFFGEIIFYGMGGVILALAAWSKGRSFSLLSIQGLFRRPLLIKHSYDLEIIEKDSVVNAKILDEGGMLMTKLTWKAIPKKGFNQKLNYSNNFIPRDKPSDSINVQITQNNRKYSPNIKNLTQIEKLFGLSIKQISLSQLTALFWVSYFVGMEYSGHRAFFSDFKLEFLKGRYSTEFTISELKSLYNQTFDLVEISGKATGLSSFNIYAYRIPQIVDYPISKISLLIGEPLKFKDKKIFISGAARGFGSVLAKVLALQGATILLNCRKKDKLAEVVKQEVISVGGICHVIEADLSREKSIKSLQKKISILVGELDWIVNNASPRIYSRKFSEQSSENFVNFIDESLAITFNTCRALLPLLNQGGWVFGISTVYLDVPKEGFSHYLAAKSALEGFLLGLAKEYQKNNFAIVRAPRMLTDQTNIVADLNRPYSAISVVKAFLASFDQIHDKGNFRKIELKHI